MNNEINESTTYKYVISAFSFVLFIHFSFLIIELGTARPFEGDINIMRILCFVPLLGAADINVDILFTICSLKDYLDRSKIEQLYYPSLMVFNIIIIFLASYYPLIIQTSPLCLMV